MLQSFNSRSKGRKIRLKLGLRKIGLIVDFCGIGLEMGFCRFYL
jgi:hypothetical protein